MNHGQFLRVKERLSIFITDEYRLKQEIETKDQTIKQLEYDKDQKIRDLEYKLTEVYAHLKNISSKI